MAMEGAKSIAEFAIRRYLTELGIPMKHYTLSMDGRVGTLTDKNGDSITLEYDNRRKAVYKQGEGDI